VHSKLHNVGILCIVIQSELKYLVGARDLGVELAKKLQF